MKENRPFLKKLAKYSAGAGALALLGGSAHGQIVHVEINDTTLSQYNSITLDLNSDATNDIDFQNYYYYSTTSYYYGSISVDGLGSNSVGRNVSGYISLLSSGQDVSAGPDLFTSSILLTISWIGSTYASNSPSDSMFIAIEFDISGNMHYGWIRVSVSGPPYSLIIHDYAYEATAGVSLNAGQTTNSINAGLSTIDITCFGLVNGGATSTPSDGVAPYTYSWSTGATDASINSLSAGIYSCSVTDNAAATEVAYVTITEPALLSITDVNLTDPSACNAGDGAIAITATGGTPALSYKITGNAAQGGNTFSSLGQGAYTASVTDANNCQDIVLSNNLVGPTTLAITGISYGGITCNGDADGSISITATGGATAYSYEVTGYAAQAGNSFTALAGGDYYVTVQDAVSCQQIQGPYTITEPTVLVSTFVETDAGCTEEGAISTNTSGGTGAYTYDWSNGKATSSLSDLAAGTYSYTVEDANSCSVSSGNIKIDGSSVEADAGDAVTVCYGSKYTPDASGGTSYVWDNGVSQGVAFDVFATKTYSVTVADNDDCTDIDQVIVTVGTLPVIDVGDVSRVICPGDSVTLSATGADSYVWSGSGIVNGLIVTPDADIAYTVTGTATNGCEGVSGISIDVLADCSDPTGTDNGIITGSLESSAGPLASGSAIVSIFAQTGYGADAYLDELSTDTISTNGVFGFSELSEGSYVLKAELVKQSAYPTLMNSYYNAQFKWADADTILSSGSNVRSVSFDMYEVIPSNQGNGTFKGGVYEYSANKSLEEIIATGEPVPGAEIFLEQAPSNDPVGYTTSGADGTFEFLHMNASSNAYGLYVNIDGATGISAYSNMVVTATDTLFDSLNVVYDAANAVVGLDTSVERYVNAHVGVQLVEGDGFDLNIYPNPTDGPVFIEYNLENQAYVEIDIYSINGGLIKNVVSGQQPEGTFIEEVDTKLAPGIYFLKFRVGQTMFIKKLLIK